MSTNLNYNITYITPFSPNAHTIKGTAMPVSSETHLFSRVLMTTAFTFFQSQHRAGSEVTVVSYVVLVTEMSALLTRVSDRDLRITTVLHFKSSEG